MLTSINPLGERGRRQSFPVTAGSYVLGSTVGAGIVGAVAIALTSTGGSIPSGVFPTLLLAGGLGETLGWKVPSIRRQVDENWLTRYRGWVYGLGFGVQLGTGVATIVTSFSLYLYLIGLIVVGSPTVVVAASLTFGLTRALAVVMVGSVRDPATLRETMRRLHRAFPAVRRVTAALMGLAGMVGLSPMMVSWSP